MPVQKFWTPDKLELIKSEYLNKTTKELAKKLGCSESALLQQVGKLGLSKKQMFWTEKKISDLKIFYQKMTPTELAKKLGTDQKAVRNKAQKLGLKRATNWKISEEKYVMENYGVVPVAEMMEHLKKTKWAVINKHRELSGLRKTNGKTIISKKSKDGLAG